jgi:hypothetical protein
MGRCLPSCGIAPSRLIRARAKDGGIMRLLGTKYRRERGDFLNVGSVATRPRGT